MRVIRTAIVGQGRSGRDIHGAYLSTDPERYRIVAAVDPLPDRRERAISEYGCEAYADYEPLLHRDDIDLIVNASPSRFHVPVTLRCLEAGKNTLCEKPLACRAADVDRLISASERSGAHLAIFQQSRYSPAFRTLVDVIASGVLGDTVQINIAYNGFQRRYDWQTLVDEMAGNLLNTGPHPLDQALQLHGGDDMPTVHAVLRHTISAGDADDHVLVVLSGEGRPTIRLEISSCCAYPQDTYQVYGTLGGLRGDTQHLEWKYLGPTCPPAHALSRDPLRKPDGAPAYCSDPLEWQTGEWSMPSGCDFFSEMSRSFYSMLYGALTEGRPLAITPRQVRRQIAVIEECRRQNPGLFGRGSGKS